MSLGILQFKFVSNKIQFQEYFCGYMVLIIL